MSASPVTKGLISRRPRVLPPSTEITLQVNATCKRAHQSLTAGKEAYMLGMSLYEGPSSISLAEIIRISVVVLV